MIDPVHSLAFSMHANRGIYAILVGSGISRAAGIPTGWEVTLDLVRKLAAMSGESCDPDPETWYLGKFQRAPNYSDLLDALAKTAAERQQLLRAYWEPTEQEREDGAKQPTAAHHAIAALVAQGFVKVIVTTNFDRLLESALAEAGVVPTVISSPDQASGALPLIHTRCCVFKVHGDYLDTRIRNTPAELAKYPKVFDKLLDRVVDEFGLVVCGWSAEWDPALRAAVARAPSRRFSTYWAMRGEPSDDARKLIEHRGAQTVPIEDADTFFVSLQRSVEALEEFAKPHPLSVEIAVASMKRYLSEPRFQVQLADLIDDAVSSVVNSKPDPKLIESEGLVPNTASATARFRAYEADMSLLMAIAPIGGFWAERWHSLTWERALSRMATIPFAGSYDFWIHAKRYPATLLLYSFGLGAVEGDRLDSLGRLLVAPVALQNRQSVPAVQLLPAGALFGGDGQVARILDGMERKRAPLNDWLQLSLRPSTRRLVSSDERFEYIFDKLEILLALGHACHAKRVGSYYWAPLGSYGYRHTRRNQILSEIGDSIATNGDASSYVKSGIFGTSAKICADGLVSFREFLADVLTSWY
jgi:SIR2-like domain